ncbi:MAG: hypothetical protein J5852_05615, partial [Clostridia bacterium]|nr:hypothetical protein [Clostridia bacterium]
ITGYRAGYWGGIGTFYPGDRTSQAAKDGVVTKWVNYDPETCTYTAAFYMWRADPISYELFKYYNVTNGAHTAIMLGNFVPTSGQNPGVTANCYITGFAFTDPEIYVATDAAAGTYSGENLCAPVTDKTVDFSTSYKYSACTQLNGSGEWTDRASNTLMNAPIKTWSKYSNTGRVTLSDIPAGYFSGTATPKMLKMAGYGTSSITAGFNTEIFADSSTTYQFDMDCRAFGGYSPRLIIYDATSSGYSEVSDLTSTFNGYHYSCQFTTRSDLRTTGDGNLRFQLGLHYNSKGTTSAYVSNIQLRKVTGASTFGPNHYMNGDFTFGTVGDVGSSYATQLPYLGDVSKVSTYYDSKLMLIPDNFFNSANTALSGDTTIALKVQGQNYIEPQFKVRLKAGTYYKFSYDYRSTDDTPEFFVRDDDVDVRKLSSNSGGKYRMTYQVYNSGAEDYSRFCFSFGANSSSKTMYIGNLQLYELTGSGGSTVGANIIGNMNAILDSSVYSGITSSGTSVTLTQDDAENITRDLANGWFVALPSNVYTDDAKVVKVASDFFNYKTPAQRQELIRKVVLGRASAVSGDPTYNPNNDSANGDIKDLVHSKLATLYSTEETVNATDSMVDKMFETIMNPSDSSGWVAGGTSYYVSSTGNDSAAGTSSNTPLKTISKANSKASAGDTIYLRRGDTWYTPDATADASFTLKSGVHYAAYGSGAKPILSGSLKNYGGSSNTSGWTETSSGSHIWQYTYYSGSATTNANAGMIYFIDADGTVHPGKDIAAPDTDNNVYTYNSADLNSDLEFFAPYKSGSNTITASPYTTFGKIYVYSNTNPATRFPNIQIALTHHVVEASNGTSSSESGVTTMNNIAVMYGASHGVKSVSGGSNFWINKCEIAYIGGAPQFISAGSNRLGNGVEFGNGYTNGRVYDSYIHDCFDAGLTFQSYKSGLNSKVDFNQIYFCRNVIENCTYNIEFFLNRNDSDTMSNIYIEDNILRNAGYGWGCYDRADGGFRIGNIAASKNSYINNVSSTYIRNNIFDCTRMAQVMWTWSTSPDRHAGLTATGNTFIQRKGASDWSVMAYGPIGGSFQYASDKASLSTAAALFDTAPNSIVWLGDLG